MDVTLYLHHWEPEDTEAHIPAPTLEVEHDPEDSTFKLRIQSGHKYARSTVLVWMTRAQLESLIDAGKTALQEADLSLEKKS